MIRLEALGLQDLTAPLGSVCEDVASLLVDRYMAGGFFPVRNNPLKKFLVEHSWIYENYHAVVDLAILLPILTCSIVVCLRRRVPLPAISTVAVIIVMIGAVANISIASLGFVVSGALLAISGMSVFLLLRRSDISRFKSAFASGILGSAVFLLVAPQFLMVHRNYVHDLTLEAILTLWDETGDDALLQFVAKELHSRGMRPDKPVPYSAQPFCSIGFEYFHRVDEERFFGHFIRESDEWRREVVRDRDGAIMHTPQIPQAILVDYLQNYASRMAKAGHLSGDVTFFDECVQQYQIHRRILRDPETGLWSQGRGWLDNPTRLSPGAWSRGHGWLIRGMVDSLEYLPPDSTWSQSMTEMLQELASDLLKYQDSDGMWHQLLHLPFSSSLPESSGTALISYNLSRALSEGHLSGEKYVSAIRKATTGLQEYVTPTGIVLGACRGPGPLTTIDPYLGKPSGPENHHGLPTMVFGMLGGMLLDE